LCPNFRRKRRGNNQTPIFLQCTGFFFSMKLRLNSHLEGGRRSEPYSDSKKLRGRANTKRRGPRHCEDHGHVGISLVPLSSSSSITLLVLPHTSYLLPPTSYLLPPTSYLLPPTSYLLPPPPTSYPYLRSQIF
jgi:hypothetical protein